MANWRTIELAYAVVYTSTLTAGSIVQPGICGPLPPLLIFANRADAWAEAKRRNTPRDEREGRDMKSYGVRYKTIPVRISAQGIVWKEDSRG